MSLPCKCIHHHFTNFNENTHTFKKKYNKNRYKRKKASHSGILLIFGCVLKLEEVRFKTKIRTLFWWTKVVVVQMYLLVVVVFVKERCVCIRTIHTERKNSHLRSCLYLYRWLFRCCEFFHLGLRIFCILYIYITYFCMNVMPFLEVKLGININI